MRVAASSRRMWVLACGVLVVGAMCASAYAGTSGGASATAPKPVSGGTLTFGWTSSPNCLDPQLGNSSLDLSISRQFVDSLVDQDPATGDIVPWLASSWSANKHATSFTFFLRKGVTFSDGTRLTAAAVKANFDAISKLGAAASLGNAYLLGYEGTTVKNAYTFTVHFSKPNAQFLQGATTMSLGILSPSTLTKTTAERCQGSFAGSGPFTLENLTPNQQVVIDKRTGYAWGAQDFKHTGAAYLSRVVFRIIPDSSVRVGALMSGQVDAITDVATQDEANLRSGGFKIVARDNPGIPYNMTVNIQRLEYAVRKAMLVAIDRAQIVKTALSPSYHVATGVLTQNTPGFVNLSKDMPYDPASASKILTAAGWTPGPDGIRVKGGQRLTVTLTYANLFSGNVPTFALVQQEMKDVGIDFRTKPEPVAQFVTDLNSGGYQMIWYGQTRADADVLRQVFSTETLNRAGITTPGGLLQKTLDQQAATTDTGLRNQLNAKVQRLLLGYGYLIPIFNQTTVLGSSSKVNDLGFEASSRVQLFGTWKSN